MLEDLDEAMKSKKISNLVVFGDTTLGNPELAYVVGGNLARGGIYLKKQGEAPLLVVSNLDQGTARRLNQVKMVRTYTEYGFEKLTKRHGRDKAFPLLLLRKIMREEQVKGTVALSGRNSIGTGIYLADELRKMGFKVTGETAPTLLDLARETKSKMEIDELRRVAAKTCKIVDMTLDVLRNLRRKRGQLELDGGLATVGRVKSWVGEKLAQQNLMAPEGIIFAQGSSSADPHHAGIGSEKLKEGKLIVFDVFPQAETGYWCDVTRSFVIGRAGTRAKRLFDAVYEAQVGSLDYLVPEVTGEQAMSNACDIIERHGYRTIRDVYAGKAPSLPSGFTHSLGHGVGLTIGERPNLAFSIRDRLKKGSVVTVEPGVYVRDFGGVRIEDTVVIGSRGAENLINVEKELELR